MISDRLQKFTRQDPAHVLAPGLFRLERGDKDGKRATRLDVTYRYNSTEQLRFTGFEALSVDDLRVLQGLAALSTEHRKRLLPDPKSDLGARLRKGLGLKEDAVSDTALAVECTVLRLLRDIGYQDSGQNRALVINSLYRLANVTVKVTVGKRSWISHLLSYVEDLDGDGFLHVALNPRLTHAIMGHGRYVRIDMEEVRALKSDHARLIHQRLCGVVDAGVSKKIKLSTLAGYVWPDSAKDSATRRKRIWVTRKALRELDSFDGWTVCAVEGSSETVTISRNAYQRIDISVAVPALKAVAA